MGDLELPLRWRWGIGLLCLVLFLPILLLRGALIDPLPSWATITAATAGGAAGLYLLILLNPWLKKQRDWRSYAGIVMTPVLSAMLATFYLRTAVEVAAFTGATTRTETIDAEVTEIGKRRSADVRAAPNARTLSINIDSDLSAELDPRRAPGRDCLKITVETGRWGIRRTQTPALFDKRFGIDRLVPCPASAADDQ
ncbi:hypothetical protein [Sphingomonas koreensis]